MISRTLPHEGAFAIPSPQSHHLLVNIVLRYEGLWQVNRRIADDAIGMNRYVPLVSLSGYKLD